MTSKCNFPTQTGRQRKARRPTKVEVSSSSWTTSGSRFPETSARDKAFTDQPAACYRGFPGGFCLVQAAACLIDCVSTQVLDAVPPQQPEGVRSRPRFNSQSSSAEQSFSFEGFSSEAEESKKPGDFQTIFGEFRPGQTFATLQSLGDGKPRSGGTQSTRIPPTPPIPQTINQQRFEQNQIVEQPQRFRQPQRFEQNQRFEQPRTTAQPQRFEQSRTSVQPQRFEQPRTAQVQNFGQNQRFSAQQQQQQLQLQQQQPSRSQRPGSLQRFTPQLQNSEDVQRFEQRQQQSNQIEENNLNLGSGSNSNLATSNSLSLNSNLRQNSFKPPSVPQPQPVKQSGFQQVQIL